MQEHAVPSPFIEKKNEWLSDVNSQSLQVVLQNLDMAYSRFFRNIATYPNFKKKKAGGSFTVPQHFSINDNHLSILKFKTPLCFFMRRNIEGEMRSFTVTKTPSEKHYVSILAGRGKEYLNL
ncbi:MAG: hypothetical protein LVQ96_06905 [Thermoplasmatales archaeon]|nr:hypothetical protein [Thermoplasmatales archaeon]MCW6170883.1 hypothetical protein [Thermoplasmatales archaeon]